MQRQGRKGFFFEKKKQKTFFLLLVMVGAAGQEPARDFGYFAGDLITSHALITGRPGTRMDTATLPAPGAVSPTIDLREIHAEQIDATTYRITTVYQNFLAPDYVTRAEIPPYKLGFTDHSQTTVAGFGVTISPFRHDLQPVVDPAALRPDPQFAGPSASGETPLMAASGAAAILCATLLLGSAIRIPPRAPFATIAKKLARNRPSAEALQELHRAFDATAGRRILAQDVESFIAAHPSFAPLRAEIDAFFAASSNLFFGAASHPAPDTARLARALARAERRV